MFVILLRKDGVRDEHHWHAIHPSINTISDSIILMLVFHLYSIDRSSIHSSSSSSRYSFCADSVYYSFVRINITLYRAFSYFARWRALKKVQVNNTCPREIGTSRSSIDLWLLVCRYYHSFSFSISTVSFKSDGKFVEYKPFSSSEREPPFPTTAARSDSLSKEKDTL